MIAVDADDDGISDSIQSLTKVTTGGTIAHEHEGGADQCDFG